MRSSGINEYTVGPWIGMTQPGGSEEPLGGWQWTNGEPLVMDLWETDQPNESDEWSFYGPTENSIAMLGDTYRLLYHWYDLSAGFPGVGYVVEWDECPCTPDLTGDCDLSILDFVAFQQAWMAGEDVGDCDGNVVWIVLDFVYYQQAFIAGCAWWE